MASTDTLDKVSGIDSRSLGSLHQNFGIRTIEDFHAHSRSELLGCDELSASTVDGIFMAVRRYEDAQPTR